MAAPKIQARLKPEIVPTGRVVNQSARTAPISLLVLHTTEGHNRPGNSDLLGLWDYFNTASVEASSHVVVDADGHSVRCVDDKNKAWTCAGFNSASLNIEQIGFTATSSSDWRKNNWKELHETARWLAQWSEIHNIPLRKGAVSGSTVTRSGVIRHMDLGSIGGGHGDPGANYPFYRVLALARLYKAARKIAK